MEMSKIKLEISLEELAKAIMELPVKEREKLWSLLATIEEEFDPGALATLEESEEDVKKGSAALPPSVGGEVGAGLQKGRLHTFEEVFGESL